jgi:hypothetical protein
MTPLHELLPYLAARHPRGESWGFIDKKGWGVVGVAYNKKKRPQKRKGQKRISARIFV